MFSLQGQSPFVAEELHKLQTTLGLMPALLPSLAAHRSLLLQLASLAADVDSLPPPLMSDTPEVRPLAFLSSRTRAAS